jgi:antitoxin ParD1/3/4
VLSDRAVRIDPLGRKLDAGLSHGTASPPCPETRSLGKIWQGGYGQAMSTMNISLPESLKAYVDAQVTDRGYGTSSEYVRDLIRKDQDRQRLRALLLEGAASETGAEADAGYFAGLRARAAGQGEA